MRVFLIMESLKPLILRKQEVSGFWVLLVCWVLCKRHIWLSCIFQDVDHLPEWWKEPGDIQWTEKIRAEDETAVS